MVPAAAPVGETPSPTTLLLPLCCHGAGTPQKQRPGHVPHPECGSRTPGDKYLILVITRVEAGDRGPSCRSEPSRPCWPLVGGQDRPVVDTWTTRRLYTDIVAPPLPLPGLPPVCPQPLPPVGGPVAGKQRVRYRRRSPIRRPEACFRRSGRSGAPERRRSGASTKERCRPGRGDLQSSGGYEISPGCAHSWGQLLDLSIEVTVRTLLLTTPEPCTTSTPPWGQLWIKRLCRPVVLRTPTAARCRPPVELSPAALPSSGTLRAPLVGRSGSTAGRGS